MTECPRVEDEWTSRALSIPFELLRRSKRVVAVAAGLSKVDSVASGARTGVLDRLLHGRPHRQGHHPRARHALTIIGPS